MEFIFSEAIPLSDFFKIIDEHYSLRKSLAEKSDALEKKAEEFRII